jgi:hypothetical protein
MVKVIIQIKDGRTVKYKSFFGFLSHVSFFLCAGYSRNRGACVTPQKVTR